MKKKKSEPKKYPNKIDVIKFKIFNSINEAVSNYNFVIATSARKRFLRKPHKKDFLSLFKE